MVGVGSGGTLTGLTRYFRRVQPELAFVLADPAGSVLAEYITHRHASGEAGSWAVEGIGEDFVPAIADLSGVQAGLLDPRRRELRHRARAAARGGHPRRLLHRHAAGRGAALLPRADASRKRVVSFVCDTGTRYLSKVYNDAWMIDQGLLPRPRYGDLRDLISRRFEEGSVVSVGPDDTLLTAFQRMRLADVSQLPVLDDGRLVGVIDESDLLLSVHADAARFSDAGQQRDDRAPETLAPAGQPGRARGRARPRAGRHRRRRRAASTA